MNKGLKTGYKEVDKEHRDLEGSQKKVVQAIRSKNHVIIKNAFDNYVTETKEHFSHEEEIMEQYVKESLPAHKSLHEEYLKLLDLTSVKIYENMDFKKFKKEFKNACHAMTRHIVNFDVPIFEIIQKRKRAIRLSQK